MRFFYLALTECFICIAAIGDPNPPPTRLELNCAAFLFPYH